MTKQVVKGFAVQFPEGRLAIESGSNPVPWIRKTKAEAVRFACDLAAHGVEKGKPVRVVVSVSVLDSPA